MDAKEAIEFLKGILFILNSGETVILPSASLKVKNANNLAIEALEKVPVLEAENAKLKNQMKKMRPRTYDYRGEESPF